MKNCLLWKGLTLKKYMDNCLLWEGPHAGAQKSMRRPPPEEEGAAEMCDKLTATPTPFCVPLRQLGGGGRDFRE